MQAGCTHIETTLPRPWEVEASFQDHIYHWMQRAPWLAISACAHLLAFFLLMTVPWERFQRDEGLVFKAQPPQVVEDPFEPLVPETPEVVSTPDELVDPELRDADLVEAPSDAEPTETSASDVELAAFAPFDETGFSDVIGIGGSPSGKYGQRLGRGGRPSGGRGTERAVQAGLEWLAAHQSPDGSWDGDGFADQCGSLGSNTCSGRGYPTHDVGLTGLALLAFLGDGNTTERGPFRDVVASGMRWLYRRQNPDTGLVGDDTAHDFVYDHAIATLALCENLTFERSPVYGPAARRAVGYIVRARDPYGAWRYDVPSLGASDTSVTGWMVFALAAAREAGIAVDPAAFEGALSWLDEVTDPASGLTGYDRFGSASSRTPANEPYPRERGEALTAVALLSRFFLDQAPEAVPVMARQAERLRRLPPRWDDDGLGCDMYYWYYGTYAMYQMGGAWWSAWNDAMKQALLPAQRGDGDERGSWDPVGPWGYAGGRVYSTALLTLSLQVYYRYTRLVGAR